MIFKPIFLRYKQSALQRTLFTSNLFVYEEQCINYIKHAINDEHHYLYFQYICFDIATNQLVTIPQRNALVKMVKTYDGSFIIKISRLVLFDVVPASTLCIGSSAAAMLLYTPQNILQGLKNQEAFICKHFMNVMFHNNLPISIFFMQNIDLLYQIHYMYDISQL